MYQSKSHRRDTGNRFTAEPACTAEPASTAEPVNSDEPAELPDIDPNIERKNGEHFEGIVIIEGMEEAVQFEHIRNDTIGIELDYEYELFDLNDTPKMVHRSTSTQIENTLSICYNPSW